MLSAARQARTRSMNHCLPLQSSVVKQVQRDLGVSKRLTKSVAVKYEYD